MNEVQATNAGFHGGEGGLVSLHDSQNFGTLMLATGCEPSALTSKKKVSYL